MGAIQRIQSDNPWDAISQLRTDLTEQLASQASSFNSTAAFLLGMTQIAEASVGTLSSFTASPGTAGTGETWMSIDPTAEASITLVTSSTGRLGFMVGGFVGAAGTLGSVCTCSLGVEVLAADGVTQLRPPALGDGPFLQSAAQVSFATVGQAHAMTLDPNVQVTIRVRRGMSAAAGTSSAATATAWWQGTSLFVSKLGM